MRNRASARSEGVPSAQPGNARWAAAIAASTSSGPESGALVYSVPVTGSISGAVSPVAASRSSPSMKLPTVVVIPLLYLDRAKLPGGHARRSSEEWPRAMDLPSQP